MGIYLNYANQCLQHLKPQVEKRFKQKLEDMVVKPSSEYPEYDINSEYLNGNLMFVVSNYPNTLFITEENYEKKEDPLNSIPKDVVHELSHKIHRKLARKKFDAIKKASGKRRFVKRYREGLSFREGFAEYATLEHLLDIYNYEELGEAAKTRCFIGDYRHFPQEDEPYERGYKFFQKILSVIGKDKLLEVATSPPISETEVRIPLLYLLRRYPTKGIKSAPKFLAKGIRTKILKTLHGSAPPDFLQSAKGSGRGKVFKALPVTKN